MVSQVQISSFNFDQICRARLHVNLRHRWDSGTIRFMKIILVLVMAFLPQLSLSETKTFREKLKDKIKERVIKRQEAKPEPTAAPATNTQITKPGDYTFSFEHQGRKRFYLLHIPASYKETEPTALIVALHGGGGNMNHMAEDKNYKLISKSEQAGFIVVFPNGTSKFNSGKFSTWNAGNCCGYARDNKIDDVGFIKEMINRIKNQVSIDQNKIFATGMSNGGMMSYRLACEMSDTFKAIAPVAGTDGVVDCKPKDTISVLHIHAKNDDHVLFTGGAGKNASDKALISNFVSVPKTIEKWLSLNACNKNPRRVLDLKGAYCDLYSECKNQTKVKLCVTDTGAHSWPGGEKTRGSEPTSKAISANDVMWEFFQ